MCDLYLWDTTEVADLLKFARIRTAESKEVAEGMEVKNILF